MLKTLVKNTLKQFDIGILKYSRLQILEGRSRASDDIELLLELSDRHTAQLLRFLHDLEVGPSPRPLRPIRAGLQKGRIFC